MRKGKKKEKIAQSRKKQEKKETPRFPPKWDVEGVRLTNCQPTIGPDTL